MKRMVSLATAAALLATAMLAPAAAAGVSDNASFCSSFKATSLTIQLPAGYWTQGPHTFRYIAAIPADYAFDGQEYVEDDTWSFTVDPGATLYRGNALLYDAGPDGKAILAYGEPDNINLISPAQPTAFFGFFGWEYRHWMTPEQVSREYAGLTMKFQWDENGWTWVQATKGPLMSLCAYGQQPPFTGQFMRTWGHS